VQIFTVVNTVHRETAIPIAKPGKGSSAVLCACVPNGEKRGWWRTSDKFGQNFVC